MVKIITIVGARPQFVKAAALSRELGKHHKFQELIVHTGQHFDKNMSDVFFEEMEIPKPHVHLHINSLSHGAMTGRMLEKIEELLLHEKPDMVMVYGDTNSTIAGALAARKLHIKVAHVEAGLRSFNMEMPEEVNRILTDRISDLLFCPTSTAMDNLRQEGYDHFETKTFLTGDVMQDAAYFYADKAAIRPSIPESLGIKDYVLVTVHRQENTDNKERFSEIVQALNELHKQTPVILPLHPRAKKMLDTHGLQLNVHTIDPVGYFDMINLIIGSSLVMTDSGGLQKEAYFFKSPCVTLRDQTEWTELIDQGFNKLAGADAQKILATAHEMMMAKPDYSKDLYGGGHACENIAAVLEKEFS